MFGQGRRLGRRAAPEGFDPAGFGGFTDIFDAFFGGTAAGGARRGPAAGRLGPSLRPPDHVRGGRPRDREGDRVPGPRPLRDVRRQRRQAGHRARRTCPQCGGRGEIRSIRQTMLGQMVNVSACPAARARARSSSRRARRATARAGPSASGRCGSRSRPGIDEGHQIRLSNEGEIGPRGGAAGHLYVAVHVTAPPDPHAARAPSCSTRPTCRSPRRRSARRITVPTADGEERRRGQGRARSRAPRSGCAAGACRTCAGRGSRGDLHVIVERHRPDQALEAPARAARASTRPRAARRSPSTRALRRDAWPRVTPGPADR